METFMNQWLENIMSYAPENCIYTFTAGQLDRALYFRLTTLSYYDSVNCAPLPPVNLAIDKKVYRNQLTSNGIKNVNISIKHYTE